MERPWRQELCPRAQLREGQRVLVNGAAGGVGSIAVQLARARGAHVTGGDHADRLEILRSLGADAVVDFTRGWHASIPRVLALTARTPGRCARTRFGRRGRG